MNRIARRSLSIAILLAAASFAGGCKDKPKEIPSLAKAEAANLIAEAQFAMQIREFKRAEELVQRTLKIRDDMPEYFVMLGMISKRLNKTEQAKKAYQRGLELHESLYKKNKEPEDIVQQAWVLALLGRTDEAAKILKKAKELHPKDTYVTDMTDPEHGLPRTFKDPGFKELAL